MSGHESTTGVDADGLQAIIAEAARRATEGTPYSKAEAVAAAAELGLSEDDVMAAWESYQLQQSRRRRRLRNNRLLLVGSALFVIVGIVSVGTWRAFTPSTAKAATAAFAGSWDTNWGRLELVPKRGSDELEGRYAYDAGGRQQAGVLKGFVEGNVLVATWQEQRPDGHHTGPAQFELQPGGQSFKGAWGDGEPPDPDGAWSGTRAALVP
jgi:hypothetical protein